MCSIFGRAFEACKVVKHSFLSFFRLNGETLLSSDKPMCIVTARSLQVQNMLCSIVVLLAHIPLRSCLRHVWRWLHPVNAWNSGTLLIKPKTIMLNAHWFRLKEYFIDFYIFRLTHKMFNLPRVLMTSTSNFAILPLGIKIRKTYFRWLRAGIIPYFQNMILCYVVQKQFEQNSPSY